VELRTSTPPTQPIEIELKKGQIELTLPATSNFQIDAASRHGEVESDFSGPGLKVAKEGDNPTISGAVGKGGPPIRLDTEYGTIRLLRMGPHPPTPPAHRIPRWGGEASSERTSPSAPVFEYCGPRRLVCPIGATG